MKAKYSLDVRTMNDDEIKSIIAKYTNFGWELVGGFYLGKNNFHKFLTFVWNKETEPVYPK